jgi:hypothetical protein
MSPSDTTPRSSEEAERDVAEARADLRSSIEELEDRFSPEAIVNDAIAYFRGDGSGYGAAIAREARANPLAALMVAAGLTWLVVGAGRRAPPRRPARRPGPAPDPYRGERPMVDPAASPVGTPPFRSPSTAPSSATPAAPGLPPDPTVTPATGTSTGTTSTTGAERGSTKA